MSDSEDDFDDDPSLDEEPIHRAAREGDLAALRRELDAGYSPDMRLAPVFSKIFPHSRLPHEMVALVVSFWAHVGHY